MIAQLVGGATRSALDVLAATPTPKTPDPDLVTPGVWGFTIIFLIAVATILLVFDMTRRVRRTRYRAEVNQKLDAEEASERGDASTATTGAGASSDDVNADDTNADDVNSGDMNTDAKGTASPSGTR